MDEKAKRLLDIKPSDIWKTGGPGNVFVFSNVDLQMNRLKQEQALSKYYTLIHYGKVIFKDSWWWNMSSWRKELVTYKDDYYIAIFQNSEIYSVEKIEDPTYMNVYVEYELASKLRGDGFDGDFIPDVRSERERQDYLRKIFCENKFNPLCKP